MCVQIVLGQTGRWGWHQEVARAWVAWRITGMGLEPHRHQPGLYMGWEERRQVCLPERFESWSSTPPLACLKSDLQRGFVEGRVLLSEGLVLVGGQHPLLSGLTQSTSSLRCAGEALQGDTEMSPSLKVF